MSFGERFLRYPGLFPARLAGEPWGDRRLLLAAAGGPYLLTDLDAEGEAALRAHFDGFCLTANPSDPPAAVDCRVLRVAASEFLPIDTRGWELTLDLERQPQALRVAGLGLMARLAWRPELEVALWTDSAAGLPGAVENVLRIAVAYRLAELGGALLHGAAVVDGDGAAVFLGPSGAGKSTLARLSLDEGKTVLSDDLVALAWRDGEPAVEALPFGGDVRPRAPLQHPLPLRSIYRLAQGPEHRVTALGRGQALATLVACSPYVNRDPLAADALFASLVKLVDSVPVRLLTFARRRSVWTALVREASLPA